ncbi:unnamed protein product [Meloidogyne enterolobii]|uniref:Uncharacterized protein n=2 Tax=Meloidogyne enterolobii TaxID=390850 RepID=A0ACB0YF64_MELEN
MLSPNSFTIILVPLTSPLLTAKFFKRITMQPSLRCNRCGGIEAGFSKFKASISFSHSSISIGDSSTFDTSVDK